MSSQPLLSLSSTFFPPSHQYHRARSVAGTGTGTATAAATPPITVPSLAINVSKAAGAAAAAVSASSPNSISTSLSSSPATTFSALSSSSQSSATSTPAPPPPPPPPPPSVLSLLPHQHDVSAYIRLLTDVWLTSDITFFTPFAIQFLQARGLDLMASWIKQIHQQTKTTITITTTTPTPQSDETSTRETAAAAAAASSSSLSSSIASCHSDPTRVHHEDALMMSLEAMHRLIGVAIQKGLHQREPRVFVSQPFMSAIDTLATHTIPRIRALATALLASLELKPLQEATKITHTPQPKRSTTTTHHHQKQQQQHQQQDGSNSLSRSPMTSPLPVVKQENADDLIPSSPSPPSVPAPSASASSSFSSSSSSAWN